VAQLFFGEDITTKIRSCLEGGRGVLEVVVVVVVVLGYLWW